MQIAGFICGLVGGLISLIVGMFGSVLFGMAGAGGSSLAGLYIVAAYGLPILAIVGAGVSFRHRFHGGLMMLGSALGTVALFGFGGFSILPTLLIGIGGVLAILADQQAQRSR